MPISVLSKSAHYTRRKSPSPKSKTRITGLPTNTKLNFIDLLHTNHQTKTEKMSNSESILDVVLRIVKEKRNPNMKCPTGISKDMLFSELDCEDLRSREKTVTIEELWKAYVNVNLHLFSSNYNKKHKTYNQWKSMFSAKH
jgi:hypothetical protein